MGAGTHGHRDDETDLVDLSRSGRAQAVPGARKQRAKLRPAPSGHAAEPGVCGRECGLLACKVEMLSSEAKLMKILEDDAFESAFGPIS